MGVIPMALPIAAASIAFLGLDRPNGAKDCSHGCSAGSPTGDPERNPWKGEPCVPAPAGAEETFGRLNENPTSWRPSTTCVSGVGNDKRCSGAGQVSGSSGAHLPEELPT